MMRGLFIWWTMLGLLTGPSIRAVAAPDTLRLSRFHDQRYAYDRAVLAVTSPATSFRDIRAKADWQPLRRKQATSAQRAYWMRWVLENDTDSARTIYAFVHDNQTATVYLVWPAHVDSLRTGSMIPARYWPAPYSDQYVPMPLPARQRVTLYVRLANAPGLLPALTNADRPRPSLGVRLETDVYHTQNRLNDYQKNSAELLYRSWIQGALLFWVLFVGLIYARYRQPIYHYYWLYGLAGCTFALLKTRSYTPLGYWIGQVPLLRAHLPETIMWLCLAAYLLFISELLNLRRDHPGMARRLRIAAAGFAGFGILYGSVLMLTNDGGLQQAVFWGTRFLLLPVYVALLVWVGRRVRSPLTRYVLLGNGLLTGVGLLAWLRAGEVILKGVTLPGGIDNLMTVSFAVLLEITVFALALAHRIQLVDQARQASQTAYVEEIEQRTAYEKRLAEVEMLALRSRMNPHFLFNSLNTIEYFVLKGDEEKATRYLSSFSRLLRLILNHSTEETVRVSAELTGLSLYLELEASRFDDNFRYTIEIDATVDTDDVLIPPLLLQPFVENAIWHGLQHSQRPDKRLWVRVLPVDDQTIRFEIEDNGIGRAQAEQLKSQSVTSPKSLGMDITRQRIDLFNRNYPTQLDLQLIDLNQQGETGTLVRITCRLNVPRFVTLQPPH